MFVYGQICTYTNNRESLHGPTKMNIMYFLESFVGVRIQKKCVRIRVIFFRIQTITELYTNILHVRIRTNFHVYKQRCVCIQTIGDPYTDKN